LLLLSTLWHREGMPQGARRARGSSQDAKKTASGKPLKKQEAPLPSRTARAASLDARAGVTAADFALRALGEWFDRQRRVLPWREDPSPYRVWVSEIMLQQTQVATVTPYFERFLKRFPTVESLASASEDEVVAAWAGLGYYSRARNLRAAAQAIVRDGFPRDRVGWLALPGVGEYTAGAVLSIAFNETEALVDGNVERVLSRLRRIRRPASSLGFSLGSSRGDSAYKARLWRTARFAVTRGAQLGVAPRVLNQALMELGAMICSPKSPKCGVCPVADSCRARKQDEVALFPQKKKPKEWIDVSERVLAAVDSRGRWLVRKNAPGEWRAGLWDFPKYEDFEGKTVEVLAEAEVRYVVTRHRVRRLVTLVRVKDFASLRGSEAWGFADSGGGAEGAEWRIWDEQAGEQETAGVGFGSAFWKSLERIRNCTL